MLANLLLIYINFINSLPLYNKFQNKLNNKGNMEPSFNHLDVDKFFNLDFFDDLPSLTDETFSFERSQHDHLPEENQLHPHGLKREREDLTQSLEEKRRRVAEPLLDQPVFLPSFSSFSFEYNHLSQPFPLPEVDSYQPAPAPFCGQPPFLSASPFPPTPPRTTYPPLPILPMPAINLLSTQVVQSYSHVSRIASPVYEIARKKIRHALREVLPEIEELDHSYKKICEEFFQGQPTPKLEGISQELMPYQWRGFKWMEIFYKHGIGGCLGDEMGLGKTIQSIALIQAIVNEKKLKGETPRILIVAPANLMKNWSDEIKKNAPGLENQLNILEKKSPTIRDNFISLVSHQKVRLLSPQEEEKDVNFPFNQEWDLVLIDECHTFLNSPLSKKVVTQLRNKTRGPNRGFFGLTGTPMPNHLLELYALNVMLNPDIYPPLSEFKKQFINPARTELKILLTIIKKNNGRIPSNYSSKKLEEYIVQMIEMLTKPFLLRRLKKEEEFIAQTAAMKARGSVIQFLSSQKEETKVSYPFSELQTTLIQQVLTHTSAEEMSEVNENGALSLFNTSAVSKKEDEDEEKIGLRDYLCLQQIADHPSIMLGSDRIKKYFLSKVGQLSPRVEKIEVNFDEEGKLRSIMQLVDKILRDNPQDKILIFTNFEKMGHLICLGLKATSLHPMMDKVQFLFGKVKKSDRQQIIEQFKNINGPPALVVGRKLGSMGWNCTEANHLVIVDPWWNPNDDEQCIGRINRIGQTKPIHVYRMHNPTFIGDEKMESLRHEKKAWCDLILSGVTTDIPQRMREILQRGTAETK